MKLKYLLIFGASMMILTGCNDESEAESGESEEGMGTLSAESEGQNGSESSDSSEEGSETNNNNSEEQIQDAGLIDISNNEEGWVNFDGEVGGNSEYRMTPSIEYNPEQDYELAVGAYISYFSGEEFIKTVLQHEEGPIERVEEADNIVVSYHNSFGDQIALHEK